MGLSPLAGPKNEPVPNGVKERGFMADTATLLKGTASDILGTGRRKTAVARVRLRPGQGVIVINGRPLDEYFHNVSHRNAVVAPLVQLGKREAMST